MKEILLTLLTGALFLQPVGASGQGSLTIKGKIEDQAGNSLAGANVLIVNTSYGTASDQSGYYIFYLPETERGRQVTLEVRYIGYRSQSESMTLTSGTIVRNFQLVEDPVSLRPVVVSARRRREDLQKVPISISAVSAATIRKMAADRVLDLEHAIPNLRFNRTPDNTGTDVVIRGIKGYSRHIGYDARAGIYVDGVYAGRSNTVNQDLLDIEQVEVLRGPQGTLFGRNTTSGAISIRTRKPHGNREGIVRVEAGNFNYIKTNAIVNVPLVSSRLFARVAAKKTYRKGFIENVFDGTDLNGANTVSGRAQFRYIASDALVFDLSVDGIRERIGNYTTAIPLSGNAYELAPGPQQVCENSKGSIDRDLFGSALTADYHWRNGFSLLSISSYHRTKWQQLMDLDGSPTSSLFGGPDEESRHFVQEIQLTSPAGSQFDFVTGLFALHQQSETATSYQGGPEFPIPGFNVTTPGQVTTNSLAGYFHGNWHLTNRLTLTAGVRYTYERKKINYSIKNDPEPFLFIDLDDFKDDFSDGVFSPKGGVNISVTDDVLLYGSVARGYKSGGWNADLLSSVEQIKYEPEFATSFEIGLKSTVWQNRLRFNAAAYLAKFKDYQVYQYNYAESGGIIFVLNNAGKVTSKGLELEMSVLPLPGLAISGALGYINARFDEFKNGGGEGIHYDGHRLARAPEIEYNLAADFHQPVGQAGRIVLHADFSYVDEHFTLPSNDRESVLVESSHLVNARLGFESAGRAWGIFLWARNLTDELRMKEKWIDFFQTPVAWYEMPRTYGIELRYSFFRL